MSVHNICAILLTVILYATAQSKYPYLQPCKIIDSECQKALWQNAIPYMVLGIPEMKIPPMDPLRIKNVTVEIPNIFKVRVKKGALKGYKSCVYDDVKTNFYKGRVNTTIDVNCNISIKGYSNITAKSSIIPILNSKDDIRVDDIAKIKLVNLRMIMRINGKVVRDKEGVIKTKLVVPIEYKYFIGGPVTFAAKKITIGKEDITEVVLHFLNANWRLIMDSFGAPSFNKAIQLLGDLVKKFFRSVPAKEFISDSLEQYLKN